MLITENDTITGYPKAIPLTGKALVPYYKEALEFTEDYLMGDDDPDYYPEYSVEAEQTILDTCEEFLSIAEEQASDELKKVKTVDSMGHNLYFSSVGHGAGFFDNNMNKLQEIAKQFHNDFYIGDDGLIYG
jgi:hypothetical protein